MCRVFDMCGMGVHSASAVALALILLLCPLHSQAAAVCYDLWDYPATGALEPTPDGGIRVLAIGRDYDRENRAAPVLEYHSADGWRRAGTQKCLGDRCKRQSVSQCELPEITLSEVEQGFLRGGLGQSDIRGVCAQGPDRRYFGIGFYAGEGVDNIGGYGYFTGEDEIKLIRRPQLLQRSINTIAFDGRRLWLGTTHYAECTGTPPAIGLLQTRVEDIEVSYSANRLACGFVFHDMLVHEGELWISSDMGLTRITDLEEGWPRMAAHYVFTGDEDNPVRSTSCDALYTELLETLPPEVEHSRLFNPYDSLFNNLASMRPRFLSDYIDELKNR